MHVRSGWGRDGWPKLGLTGVGPIKSGMHFCNILKSYDRVGDRMEGHFKKGSESYLLIQGITQLALRHNQDRPCCAVASCIVRSSSRITDGETRRWDGPAVEGTLVWEHNRRLLGCRGRASGAVSSRSREGPSSLECQVQEHGGGGSGTKPC